jgi:hypothetical protein
MNSWTRVFFFCFATDRTNLKHLALVRRVFSLAHIKLLCRPNLASLTSLEVGLYHHQLHLDEFAQHCSTSLVHLEQLKMEIRFVPSVGQDHKFVSPLSIVPPVFKMPSLKTLTVNKTYRNVAYHVHPFSKIGDFRACSKLENVRLQWPGAQDIQHIIQTHSSLTSLSTGVSFIPKEFKSDMLLSKKFEKEITAALVSKQSRLVTTLRCLELHDLFCEDDMVLTLAHHLPALEECYLQVCIDSDARIVRTILHHLPKLVKLGLFANKEQASINNGTRKPTPIQPITCAFLEDLCLGLYNESTFKDIQFPRLKEFVLTDESNTFLHKDVQLDFGTLLTNAPHLQSFALRGYRPFVDKLRLDVPIVFPANYTRRACREINLDHCGSLDNEWLRTLLAMMRPSKLHVSECFYIHPTVLSFISQHQPQLNEIDFDFGGQYYDSNESNYIEFIDSLINHPQRQSEQRVIVSLYPLPGSVCNTISSKYPQSLRNRKLSLVNGRTLQHVWMTNII